MTSNYPPGVTGNEYEIAGPDWEAEGGECPRCNSILILEGYRRRKWATCSQCDWFSDVEYDDPIDYSDDLRDIRDEC